MRQTTPRGRSAWAARAKRSGRVRRPVTTSCGLLACVVRGYRDLSAASLERHPLGRVASLGLDGRQALAVAPCRFVASTEQIEEFVVLRFATTPFPSVVARPGSDLSYGMLSTYPPTPCGLATFTAALS